MIGARRSVVTIALLTIAVAAPLPGAGALDDEVFADGFEPAWSWSRNTDIRRFDPSSSEAEILTSGAAFVRDGSRRIYVGTSQATATSQDPVVASFTGGVPDWSMAYETSLVDSRGVGVLWDGSSRLYVAFTVEAGGSGLESFTAAGWLSGYGPGGGPSATVLLRLDPATGMPLAGTFVSAILSSGATNTVSPTSMALSGTNVVLFADSFFRPRGVDGIAMSYDSGTSPFPYRVVFDENLSQALSAEAIGWNGVTVFSPLP